jgi:UPF0755 protein
MRRKYIFYILTGIVVILAVIMIVIRTIFFGLNIVAGTGSKVIYIPSGSSYEQVMDTLWADFDIKNKKALEWVIRKKNYPALIKPGRYVIDSDLSYVGLINLLRSGRQKPVRITFNNVRTLNQLAGRIGNQIEADSSSLISFLSDDSNYSSDGFTREDIISIFIPDTYELYWNTDARGLYRRMLREYNLFWNQQRLSEAGEKGLNPKQVSILASIIDDEVVKPDEKPRIAGVYLNRLKRGMPLQACPTIKFALNDFTITRILDKYLLVDSPYNTYKHTGFPPGPINCPSIEGLEAVLNAENHDYLFFVARDDFSGYHNFSRTLSEHNRYAAAYQRELDRRKIFK